MNSLVGGCLRRLFGLVLVAGLVVVAWHYRDALSAAWRGLRGAPSLPAGPSAELAEVAEAKLARLANGQVSGHVALSEAEVQSLVQYRLAQFLPPYVLSPKVRLQDGRVHLEVRVPVERLPRLAELGEVVSFLPDTADVTAVAQILPFDSGRVALAVDQVRAEKIPLPDRLIPGMLKHLGRTSLPGLAPDAMAVPLPPGAVTAYVRGDSLVFLAGRGNVDRL